MSLAIQNNNPGNLRDPSTGSFRKFNSPQEGYAALMNDLQGKISGATSTGLNGKSTLYDFSKTYAPAGDNNNPAQYTVNLANQLGVSPDTPLSALQDKVPHFAYAIANNEDKEFAQKYPLNLPPTQPVASNDIGFGPNVRPIVGTNKTFDYGNMPAGGTDNGATGLPGMLRSMVTDLPDAMTSIGGGILNASTAGARALGANIPATPSFPSIVNGQPVDPVGYRNGQELGPLATAEQGAGKALTTASYMVGAPEGAEALALGRAGVIPYIKSAAKVSGRVGFLQGAGQSMAAGDSPLDVGIKTAEGTGVGMALGLPIGVAGGYANKLAGYTPEILTKFDNAVQSGDTKVISDIQNSPEFQTFMKANKFDQGAIDNSVQKVKTSIETGIDNSYGVSKMTRAEKAETLTDDGVKAMLENAVDSNNPIGDTKINLENKANDLMNQGLNPIIDKIRTEKLTVSPLDAQTIIDEAKRQIDASGLTALDKEKFGSYVDNLVSTQERYAQSQGRSFDIIDAHDLRKNSNIPFDNPVAQGQANRIFGNVLRDTLTKAEETAQDPISKTIITQINAVNAEYSRLQQAIDVINLMAKFPGQKASELLNKAAGFFGVAHTGGNPIAYYGAHNAVNKLQQMGLRSASGKIFGDLSAKAGGITSSELIGNAKRVMAGLNTKTASEGLVSTLAKQSADAEAQKQAAVAKLLDTISPKRPSELPVIDFGPKAKSKFNISDPSLPSIKGSADVSSLAKLGLGSAGTVAGAAALDKSGLLEGKETYTANSTPTKPNGVVDGVDITKWATNPRHEDNINKIHSQMPEIATSSDVDDYIKERAPNSKITGDMVKGACDKYDVPVKVALAIMQEDSMFATKGLGAKTNNPGNWGNDDAGHKVYFPTIRQGVDRMVKQLQKFTVK